MKKIIAAYILMALLFDANATNVLIKYDSYEQSRRLGFFDTTERTPTAYNPGKTIGEARRYAFEYAAKIIESQVHSEADIIISLKYGKSGAAASTITVSSIHNEYFNYDDFGILKDGVSYNPIIRRMLMDDKTEQRANFYDGDMLFDYHGDNYDVYNDSEYPGFINLALHEIVHVLGFSSNGICKSESCKENEQKTQHLCMFIVKIKHGMIWILMKNTFLSLVILDSFIKVNAQIHTLIIM